MPYVWEDGERVEIDPDDVPVRDDLPRAVTCETCDGEGYAGRETALPGGDFGEVAVPCPECDGEGVVVV